MVPLEVIYIYIYMMMPVPHSHALMFPVLLINILSDGVCCKMVVPSSVVRSGC